MNMTTRRQGISKAVVFVIAVLAMICMVAMPALAGTGTVYTAAGTAVKLRAGAGTQYDAIGSVPSGTTVEITGEENGWYKVNYNGTAGFIRSDLFSTVNDGGTTDNSAAATSNTTNPGNLTAAVGSETFLLSERFTAEDIPAGFAQQEVTYQDETVMGVYNEVMNMYLVYLKADSDDTRSFYIYQPETQNFMPFFELATGENYVVVMSAPADTSIPEGYTASSLPNDKTGVLVGYVNSATLPDCYYVYCQDSNGTYGWYVYDAQYDSFTRTTGLVGATVSAAPAEDNLDMNEAYNQLKDEYTSNKNKMTKMVAGLVIGCAVLLIILVNVLIFGGRRDDQGDVFDDDEDEKPAKKESKKDKKQSKRRKKDFWDDDDDEDDEDTPIWLNKEKLKEKQKAKRRFFDDDEDEEDEDDEEPVKAKKEEEPKKEAPKKEAPKEMTLEDELRAAVGNILSEKAQQKEEADTTAEIEAALAAAVEAELRAAQAEVAQPAVEVEIPQAVPTVETPVVETPQVQVAPTVEAPVVEAPKVQTVSEVVIPQVQPAPVAETTPIATIIKDGQEIMVPTGDTIDLSSRIIQQALEEAEAGMKETAQESFGTIEDLDYAERAGVAAAFAASATEEPVKKAQTTDDGFEFFDFDDNDGE